MPAWTRDPRHQGCEVRDQAPGGAGGRHRDLGRGAEGGDLLTGSRPEGAPAGEDDGPRRRPEGLDRPFQVRRRGGRTGRGGREAPGARGGLHPGHEDVVGDLQVDRPGPARDRLVEGLVGEAREGLGAVGDPQPLGDGGQHPLLVDVLDRPAPASLERGAAGDHDQRHVGDGGVGEARHRVGEARPGGDRADPGAAGGEGEALRRLGHGALVAHADDPEALVGTAVEQLDDVPAPECEKRLHTIGAEALGH